MSKNGNSGDSVGNSFNSRVKENNPGLADDRVQSACLHRPSILSCWYTYIVQVREASYLVVTLLFEVLRQTL